MIPNNTITHRSVVTRMANPDHLKTTGLTDYELGGVSIGDATQGLVGWLWTCRVINSDVTLQREGLASQVIFTQANIADVSFAFDHNMRPAFAWQDTTGNCYLRYYDTLTLDYAVIPLGVARTPRMTLDDKRSVSGNTSDIICAYMKDTSLYYRQQRDSFLTERLLVNNLPIGQNLLRIGMGGYQLQFELNTVD